MNKDLMMKAAIQFEGKYPESPHQDVIAIGVCIKNVDVDDADLEECFKIGDIHGLGESYSNEYWEMLCTKSQFESFVNENYLKGETK